MYQAQNRYKKHNAFGSRNSQPYAGDSKKFRQKKDTAGQQDKGPKKGEECRDLSVGQGGKHGRSKNIQAAEQEAI